MNVMPLAIPDVLLLEPRVFGDERGFLHPVIKTIAENKTPAERLVERFHGLWGGDVTKVFDENAF